MKAKLTSRKFWMCIIVFLGGVASVISGLALENEALTIIGAVCGSLAGFLYTVVEAICDTTSMADSVGVLEDEIENEDGSTTTVYVNEDTDGSVG